MSPNDTTRNPLCAFPSCLSRRYVAPKPESDRSGRETSLQAAERRVFDKWLRRVLDQEFASSALGRPGNGQKWYKDLRSGVTLHRLLEVLYGQTLSEFGTLKNKPSRRTERLNNIFLLLQYLRGTACPLHIVRPAEVAAAEPQVPLVPTS